GESGAAPSRGMGISGLRPFAPERRMREHHIAVTQRAFALFLAPGPQRALEGRVGDEVAAVREHRQEAARDLVLALRAGFEHAQPLAQAVVDALVVAG